MTGTLSILASDLGGFDTTEAILRTVGDRAPEILSRAINRTGSMARTQVVRALAKQTSLPQKILRKAVKVRKATPDRPAYELSASGGDVALKYFKPRETRPGVVAIVRGRKTLFEGAFIMGGSFASGRVQLRLGGHVFLRTGGRTQFERLKSGVYIGAEMVEGASAQAFERVVADVLPRRLEHELDRALGG